MRFVPQKFRNIFTLIDISQYNGSCARHQALGFGALDTPVKAVLHGSAIRAHDVGPVAGNLLCTHAAHLL